MDKYYKTPRTSETGKKFLELKKRIDASFDAIAALSEKYGFYQWRESANPYILKGGISSTFFKDTPDPKIWKEIRYKEYMPKQNIKIGKAIQAEFDALLRIEKIELNSIVNHDGDLDNIGYTSENKTAVGFIIDSEWGITVPNDCQEITGSEYELLK